MKIGNLDLGTRPVLLAPMEDVTDIGFRLLCRQLGASMVYSEFVAADALVRMVNKSLDKLTVCDAERPVAIQIYGKDPIAVRDAAQIVVERAHPDVLDINFGCPVKKVAGKGAGAGLLQDVPRMLEITRAVVDAVNVPVTAKTRLGWDADHKIIVPLAEQLQDCGIKALTIHGRTRAQMYNGDADWTLIGEVKKNPRMHIPIIGNNHDIDHVIPSDYPTMSVDWKLDVLKEQVRQSVERIDEYRGILHIRRHLAATPIFKGIPNFRQTRIDMLRAETVEQLFSIMESTRPLIREAAMQEKA